MEQRVNLKFLGKLGKTFTEAYARLKELYCNEYLSRTKVFEWFKWFKEGHETTEDDLCPGRPSTSKMDENIEKIVPDIPEVTTKLTVSYVQELSSSACHVKSTHNIKRALNVYRRNWGKFKIGAGEPPSCRLPYPSIAAIHSLVYLLQSSPRPIPKTTVED
ncbi:hypothetical protein NQ318_010432, partial [Aromia moschata]